MTAANTAAASQAAIALDQWNTTKAYLPKAMEMADRESARSDRLADQAEEDSSFYRGIAGHQFDESKKAEPFQERMRGMATEYDSGAYSEVEAGRANADVEQGFDDATGSMARNAGRLGLDIGSGSFASAMGDMYTQKALASAGAKTNSRLNTRSKAEAMVAAAAGSGQANFANGMGAGGAASSFGSGAAGLGMNSANAGAGAMSTYNQGASSAGGLYGSASANLRANATESAKSPGFDFFAGLATGGLKAAGQAGGFTKLW